MMGHEFSDVDQRCVRCGTLKTQFESAADKNPCPRPAQVPSALRPEPALRGYAVDDSDTISARLAELKAERETGWNTQRGDDQ